jgi:hypothetical protein
MPPTPISRLSANTGPISSPAASFSSSLSTLGSVPKKIARPQICRRTLRAAARASLGLRPECSCGSDFEHTVRDLRPVRSSAVSRRAR